MAENRKTLIISGKSWHGRLYRYWLREGYAGYLYSESYGRRENLCHYVRVVLFWASLTWLARATPKKHLRWLRPWMILTAVSTIILITISCMRWPQGTWDVFRTLLAVIGTVIGATLIGVSAVYAYEEIRERLHKRPREGDSFFKVLHHSAAAKKAKICPFIDVTDMK